MPQKLRSVVERKYRQEHEFKIKLVAAIHEQVGAAKILCFPVELSYHYRHWEDAMEDDDPWEDPVGMTNCFHLQVNNFYATCGFVFCGWSTPVAYQMRKDVIVLEFCENPSASRVDLLPEYIPREQHRYEISINEATQARLIQWGFQRQIQFSKCRFWVKVYSVSPSTEQQSVVSQVIEDIGKLRSIRMSVVAVPIRTIGAKPERSTHHNRSKADLPQTGLPSISAKPERSMHQDTSPITFPPTPFFPNPEQARLLRELEDINTSHQRRGAIGEQLAQMGDPRPGVGLRPDGIPQIEWCYVAGGEVEVNGWHFLVRPFYISKYLITHSQFQAFLDAPDGFAIQQERLRQYQTRKPSEPSPRQSTDSQYDQIQQEWKADHALVNSLRFRMQTYRCAKITEQDHPLANYPRVGINWHQTEAFTLWLTEKLHLVRWPKSSDEMEPTWSIRGKKQMPRLSIRLPTEWEWLLAATGSDSTRMYPWGAEMDSRRLNSSESGIGTTTAVGMYPSGAAHCGALDMAGNVREWCLNDITNFRAIDSLSGQPRALRGGSWYDDEHKAQCTYSRGLTEYFSAPYVGFRVMVGGDSSDFQFERITGK